MTPFRQLHAVLLITFLLFCSAVFSQMRQVYKDTTPDNEIHKISFYSPSSGFVAFRDWIGFTTDSGRSFTKKYITFNNVDYNGYSVNLTFGFGINGVKAFNKDTLIAYGDYGFVPAILYSVNGGANFKLIFQSLYDPFQFNTGITDMVFPENDNIGYAVDADRILKTTDKGLTWVVIGIYPGGKFTNVEAPDNKNVFAFSSEYATNKLLKTTNSGANWQTVTLPQLNTGRLAYVTFLNAGRGWLNMYDEDNRGYLYLTTNGGTSWGLQNDGDGSSIWTNKMKFIDDSTGYALTGLFTVYKTTNSGKIWEPLPRDTKFSYLGYSHNDIHTYGNKQLWAGGGYGFLELSTNGGGVPLPKAYFKIDTSGVYATGTVSLQNFSKPTYDCQWYVNGNLVANSYHANYQHKVASGIDTIVLVARNGSVTDTLAKTQFFYVPPLPTFTGFTPESGSNGTVVTITGSNFFDINNVRFGGVAAASFTVVSPTVIKAVVAGGATGDVSVQNVYGDFAIGGFTYFAPPTAAPPVIQSFSPNSGAAGTTVTIKGANFEPVAGNNIVFFGATRATVTAATATQIICKVPAAATYVPISVLNTTTHLSGRSLKPFNLIFADSGKFNTESFKERYKFPLSASISPNQMIGHDMDGDGKPDVIGLVGDHGWDSVCVFRNISSGPLSFAPRQSLGGVAAYAPGHIELGDLDGDGKADVVAVTNRDNVLVFRNESKPGTVALSAPMGLTATDGTLDAAADDLDNDGRPDIVVAGFNNSLLSVIRNTSVPGHLSFAGTTNYPCGGHAQKVAIGDLNGDGKKDVICFNYLYDGPACNLSVFKNESVVGNISLAPKIDINVPGSALQGKTLVVADYDGDDKLDIVILNDDHFAIFRNTYARGAISFAPVADNPLPLSNQGGCIANLSGDSKPDFVAGRWGGYELNLYQNLSSQGQIINDKPVSVYERPTYYSNSADFDLDGKSDIVVSTSEDLLILRNNVGMLQSFWVCANGNKYIDANRPGTGFQWQLDTGNGFINLTNNDNVSNVNATPLYFWNVPASWNGHKFRCLVDGVPSGTFVMQIVGAQSPSASIVASATTICSGSPVTFTATASNIGELPSYQWQVNGINTGTNGPVFVASNLQNNDQVKLIVSSSDYCGNPLSATSNTIIMNVNGALPLVSVTASARSICAGTAVTFTATPVNAGASPGYQWQINGKPVGTNSSIFSTDQLHDGDSVKVTLTPTSPACGVNAPIISNGIQIEVRPNVTPSVTITTNTTAICDGQAATFTAMPVNGGNAPSFQWLVNDEAWGQPTSSVNTSLVGLKNNDKVSVRLTSDAACLTVPVAVSNAITVMVQSIKVNAGADQTICNGELTTLTAHPSNLSYTWLPAAGLSSASTAQTAASPTVTTTYVVTATNATGCTAKDTVVITVKPTPEPPVIALSNNTLTSSATANNQWYKDGVAIAGASGQAYTITANGTYTAKVIVNDCPSMASNAIIFTTTGITTVVWDNQLLTGPNPVTNELLVQYKGNNGKFRIELRDINGKETGYPASFITNYRLPMKHLAAGPYLLLIVNDRTGERIQRLVIKQ